MRTAVALLWKTAFYSTMHHCAFPQECGGGSQGVKVYRNPRAGQGSGEAGRERIPLPRYLRLQAPLQLADTPLVLTGVEEGRAWPCGRQREGAAPCRLCPCRRWLRGVPELSPGLGRWLCLETGLSMECSPPPPSRRSWDTMPTLLSLQDEEVQSIKKWLAMYKAQGTGGILGMPASVGCKKDRRRATRPHQHYDLDCYCRGSSPLTRGWTRTS